MGGEVNDEPETSYLTDNERRRVQTAFRGKYLGPSEWRNFCSDCGCPLIVRTEWMRFKDDLTCDDCRPPIQAGNSVSGAFSPDHKNRG